MTFRRSRWMAVAAVFGVAMPLTTTAAVAEESTGGNGVDAVDSAAGDWRLLQEEDFAELDTSGDTGWFPDQDGPGSPYDVDAYDNDGEYFQTVGGEDFEEHLSGIDLYRRSFTLGDEGWLTAELATRGGSDEPSFTQDTIPGVGEAGLFDSPSHDGGVVLRSTDELPEEYRIEVTLKTVDFGGQRDGEWDYDGRVNGYTPSDCATNFPWAASGDFSLPECEWHDVTTDANGFYYLSIMDYSRPAPHNNVFIHNHRKVVMDGYNRYEYTGDGLRYCDADSGELQPYEWGSGNGVNMLFMTDQRRYEDQPGTEYLMPSECGTELGGGIVSQADLMPEAMPDEDYQFAVERRDGHYVMEVSGEFRHIGQHTLRYEQPFDDGENPVWHYNQTPEEYDGQYNADWEYPSANGTYVDEDVWPRGSAYPDYFLIGQPHMNFYEGQAHIDDLRLYVPSS